MKISSLSWGKVIVEAMNRTLPSGEGRSKTTVDSKVYKDVKIVSMPNNDGSYVKEWNWLETGTRHIPGIQVGDFAEFVDKVDYVVLSKGMDEMLHTTDAAKEYLKNKNKNFVILNSRDAVAEFNRLVDLGVKVGALIHSTC
jgi:hypothetical protein